jgi:hypothetical protein
MVAAFLAVRPDFSYSIAFLRRLTGGKGIDAVALSSTLTPPPSSISGFSASRPGITRAGLSPLTTRTTRIRAGSLHERSDIALTQFHPGTPFKTTWQNHCPIPDADEAADRMTDRLQHAPHFPVTPL